MGKKVKTGQSITAILVVKNEARKIVACLNSLFWVDEIIVVDNGSVDGSYEVAKGLATSVFKKEGGTFSSRKNFAAQKASSIWLLFIDADEIVSQELKQEIVSKIKMAKLGHGSVFAIPRQNIILRKVMKYGGWWPDYAIRLFKKKSFKGFYGDLHEQPKYDGNLGYFKNFLIHNKHTNITDMIAKTNDWSEIEAKLMLETNHPPMNILRFASAGAREFYLRMIKKTAFLDGYLGVIYAIYQVYSRLVSYAKLWELQLRKAN